MAIRQDGVIYASSLYQIKTAKYHGSLSIRGARTYNTLLRNIREFKIKLKRYLNTNGSGTCCLHNMIAYFVILESICFCVVPGLYLK